MRWRLACVASLAACGPADGAVFVDSPSPVDLACDAQIGARIEGNDARFSQECGYACDSDWCGCEPCEMQADPLARLSAGDHEIRVQGGASGDGTFLLRLTLADGEVLFEAARSYNGLFTDSFVFTVPEDCAVVRLSWTLQSEVCSRVYEFELDPTATESGTGPG